MLAQVKDLWHFKRLSFITGLCTSLSKGSFAETFHLYKTTGCIQITLLAQDEQIQSKESLPNLLKEIEDTPYFPF